MNAKQILEAMKMFQLERKKFVFIPGLYESAVLNIYRDGKKRERD